MSAVSDAIRKEFGDNDDIRDAGLKAPGNIKRFDDIIYGQDDEKFQRLDVYRPADAEDILPVILSVHGGGWVYGDKERYQYYCMSLATRGFAVVNFTYRLAPEYKYPSSFCDTSLVCEWMKENAAEYGFDMDNVFAVGDSAGAHMLSLFAAALTNPDYAKSLMYDVPKDFSFSGIALNCGVYKVVLSDDPNDSTTALMREFLPGGGTDAEIEEISVINHITSEFPPTYVMTCPGDFLNVQPVFLLPALQLKNVPFEYHFYVNEENELGHVFHLNMRFIEATKCNDNQCRFFKNLIK